LEVPIRELYVIQEYKRWIRMIFGFSLCTVFLLATLFAYFGMELGDLAGGKPLEDSKIYYHQH